MLRLDLVYCISFSICYRAGLRLIVWHFLLVKAFKHPNSGCVSRTANRIRSNSEMRWLSASCCFHDKVARRLGCGHQNDPGKIQYLNSDGSVTAAGQVSVTLPLCWEAAAARGSLWLWKQGGWRKSGALLFVGSLQHPVVTGPIF